MSKENKKVAKEEVEKVKVVTTEKLEEKNAEVEAPIEEVEAVTTEKLEKSIAEVEAPTEEVEAVTTEILEETTAEVETPTEEIKAETTEKLEETTAEVEVPTEEVVKEKSKKTTKKATPKKEEEFDWEAYEVGDDEYSAAERKKIEADYEKELSTIAPNEVLDGTVVSMTDREVIVNINYKSDGIISRNEFRYNEELKAGDTVEVLVEKQEDKKGQLILSHKKARVLRSWERVNEAHDNDIVLEGFIKCRTKGGMIVEVLGLEAFLPGSQIDVKPIRDYDDYVGKKMEFKVVKINHEFRNVVVSHKALIEADLEEQKKEIMSKLEVGQVLEGTVKNITSYGVFIDLGGIDGLVHITDLSWGRVNHPDEIVTLDEKINVVILEFDDEKKRIQLGLKQLSSHPWDALDEKLAIGDKINGKVVVVADYGAFVEIQSGVEALLHVSEMSWSTHLRSAGDFLSVGQEIEAQVLTLDREERKMSLGMKQLQPDPWAEIAKKYPSGSQHKVTVRNFTNFGIFVELEEGVDGLIHISDLSWTKKVKHPSDFTKVGDLIDAQVLELDMEERKLSLGIKQLEDNPWDGYESTFGEGTEFEAEVVNTSKNGATVALPHGVEAFAPGRHLLKEDGSKAAAGETLIFRVIEFHKEAQKIVVSHTVIHKEMEKAEKKSTAKSMKKVQQKQQKSTLGDMDELVALKESMAKQEKEVK
tara:strand:- start:160 stop:2265 length:2106 start_codon:yes stop_codon:yes gene_type:complete